MMQGCVKLGVNIILVIVIVINSVQVSEQVCSVTEGNITSSGDGLSTLTSPGYNNGAGTYVRNMDCWWIIDAGSDDLKLIMYFIYDMACPNDLINIYDGNVNTASRLVTNQCGTSANKVQLVSTQRYVLLEMASDGSTEQAGFKLEHLAVKDYSGTGCTSPQTLRTTSEYQYLSSQNFPGQYSSDSNCRWNIYNPFGIVEVDVMISDMEDDNTPSVCDYDKYQIFDGENKCDNNIAREVCSEFLVTSPYSLSSNGTNLVVTLTSDDSVQNRGFYLRYKGVEVTTISSSTTTRSTSSGSTGLQLNMQIILGIIFGSIIMLCFIIMTIVFIVKRIQIPLEKTLTSQVQPIPEPRPSIDSSATVRSRKPSKSKVLSPNTLSTVSRVSETEPIKPPPYSRTKPRIVRNGAPPRGGGHNRISDTVIITDF